MQQYTGARRSGRYATSQSLIYQRQTWFLARHQRDEVAQRERRAERKQVSFLQTNSPVQDCSGFHGFFAPYVSKKKIFEDCKCFVTRQREYHMNFSQMQRAERGRSLFFQTVAHALSLSSDLGECLTNGFPS